MEADGDTTPFCVDNRVSVLHSSHSDILFTPSLLFGKEIFNITPVEKYKLNKYFVVFNISLILRLSVALIQLAQGIKLECLQSPFINETKRNGLGIFLFDFFEKKFFLKLLKEHHHKHLLIGNVL